MKKIISLILVSVLCLFCFASCKKDDKSPYTSNIYNYDDSDNSNSSNEPVQTTQKTTIDHSEYVVPTVETKGTGEFPKVKITVKDYGEINLTLNDEQAPITVANFVKLVKKGFYDGLTFHRIMQGFMIQGGDPEGTGMGGSDETIKGEFSENGVENTISHRRGVISMARSSDPDSASSQFFICDADSVFLDGQYAAFGYVTSGIEIVDKIAADANPTDSNGTITADQQPVIEKIEIVK